ncbi:MAG: site-specific integrase [Chitinophagaceae bacterium]|nr:site-specific integrase [Chitinophagaceae bacterium]
MKPTDFSKYLTDFLSKYLPGERGASRNTISAYRDTFLLFINYMEGSELISVKKLTIDMIKMESVIGFLDWLQKERKCSDSTRNVRLAAIHSFFRFMQYKNPDNLFEWQRILSVPVKKAEHNIINNLSLEGMKLLFEQPDLSLRKGRRDLALLSLMYDSGARVQEMIDLSPSMLRLEHPCTVKLVGKGNKARIVPLMDQQIYFLKQYMSENHLSESRMCLHPLFYNSRKEKLTRAGVNHILNCYANMARLKKPSVIPDKISCHALRHSKAMHLLQAGVNLVYIRDILGHTSVQTTEIYARADSKQKREALEKSYTGVAPIGTPTWLADENLLTWLKCL